MDKRVEKDSMGEMEVPIDALYGAQTRRAEINFRISGYRMPSSFITSLVIIKYSFAKVHGETGNIETEISELIQNASLEIINGNYHDHFVVDVFQTGSGTSSNMNANEVISNLAMLLSDGQSGSRNPVHPNDHVNKGQSSNDVIPSAINIAVVMSMKNDLIPNLKKLHLSLTNKSDQFNSVVKIARTHIMDATPIKMGQIFSGYAEQIQKGLDRLDDCLWHLTELPLGGTAVGTGINTSKEITQKVIKEISLQTQIDFIEAKNHFEAQSSKDMLIETSSTLKRLGISLSKIANDLRFMASGPRCGIGELSLPATQPGSSIMPGKINPVIPESVMQVSAYLVGVDSCISHAAATLSNFELSTAMPLMGYFLLESTRILSNACLIFSEKCIDGIEVNQARCNDVIELSLAMATSLVPLIGYYKASKIANEALHTGKTVREIAYEWEIADRESIDKALNPNKMTEP